MQCQPLQWQHYLPFKQDTIIFTMATSTSVIKNDMELSHSLRDEIGDGDENLDVDDICDSFFDNDDDNLYIEEGPLDEQYKDHEESHKESVLSKAKESQNEIMQDSRKIGKKRNFLEMNKDLATLTPKISEHGVVKAKRKPPDENSEDVTITPLRDALEPTISAEVDDGKGDGDKNLKVDDICDSFFDDDDDKLYIEEDPLDEQSKDHEESHKKSVLSKAKELQKKIMQAKESQNKAMQDSRKIGKKENFLELTKDLATLTPVRSKHGVGEAKRKPPDENLVDVTITPLSEAPEPTISETDKHLVEPQASKTPVKTYAPNMDVVSGLSKTFFKNIKGVPKKYSGEGIVSKDDLSMLEDTCFTQSLFRALDLKVTSQSREKSNSTSQKKFPSNAKIKASIEKTNKIVPIIDVQQNSHLKNSKDAYLDVRKNRDSASSPSNLREKTNREVPVIELIDIPTNDSSKSFAQDESARIISKINEESASITRVPESISKRKVDEERSPECCEGPSENDGDVKVLSPHEDTSCTGSNEESTYEDNFQPVITQVFSVAPPSNMDAPEKLPPLTSTADEHPQPSDQGSSNPSNVCLLTSSTNSTSVINSLALTGGNATVKKSIAVQPTDVMTSPVPKSRYVHIQPGPRGIPNLAPLRPKELQLLKHVGGRYLIRESSISPRNKISPTKDPSSEQIHEFESPVFTGNKNSTTSPETSNVNFEVRIEGESLGVRASQQTVHLPTTRLSSTGKQMPKLNKIVLPGNKSLNSSGEAVESADREEIPMEIRSLEKNHESPEPSSMDWVMPSKGASLSVSNLPKDVQSEPLLIEMMMQCEYFFTEGTVTISELNVYLDSLKEIVKKTKNLSSFRKFYGVNLIDEISSRRHSKVAEIVLMYRSDIKDLFTKDFDQHAFLYFEASMGFPLEMCIICLEMKKKLLFLKFLNHFVEDHVQKFPAHKIFSYSNKMKEVLQKMKKSFRYMKNFGNCLLSFNIEKQIKLISSSRLHDASDHSEEDAKLERRRQQRRDYYYRVEAPHLSKKDKVARNIVYCPGANRLVKSANENSKQNKPNNFSNIEFLDERIAVDEDPLSVETVKSEDTLFVKIPSASILPADPKKPDDENCTKEGRSIANPPPIVKPPGKNKKTKRRKSKNPSPMDDRGVESRGDSRENNSVKKRRNKEKIKSKKKKVKINGKNKSDKNEINAKKNDIEAKSNQTNQRGKEDNVDDENDIFEICDYEEEEEEEEDQDDYDEVDVEAVNKKIMDILSVARAEMEAEEAKKREIDQLSHIIKPSRTYQKKVMSTVGKNESDSFLLIDIEAKSNQIIQRRKEDNVDEENNIYEICDYKEKEDQVDVVVGGVSVNAKAVNNKVIDILSIARAEIEAEEAKKRGIDQLSHIIKPSRTYQKKVMNIVEVSPYMRVLSPRTSPDEVKLPIKTYSKQSPPIKVPLTTGAHIQVNSLENDEHGKENTDTSEKPTNSGIVTKAGNRDNTTAFVVTRGESNVVDDTNCRATTVPSSIVMVLCKPSSIDNALVTPDKIKDITWHLSSDNENHWEEHYLNLDKIHSPNFGKIEFLNDCVTVDPVVSRLEEKIEFKTRCSNATKRKSKNNSEITHQIKKICVRQTDSCIEISAKIIEEGGEKTDEDNDEMGDSFTDTLHNATSIYKPLPKIKFGPTQKNTNNKTKTTKMKSNSVRKKIPKTVEGNITSTHETLPQRKSESFELLPKENEGIVTSTHEPVHQKKYDSTKIKSNLEKEILAKKIDEIITSNAQLLPEIKLYSTRTESTSTKKNREVLVSKSEPLPKKEYMTKSNVQKNVLTKETEEVIISQAEPIPRKKIRVTETYIPEKVDEIIPEPRKKKKSTKTKSSPQKPLLSEKTRDSQNELDEKIRVTETYIPEKVDELTISEPLKKKSKSIKTKSSPQKPLLSEKTGDSQNELDVVECPKKLAVQQNSSHLIDEKMDLTEKKSFTPKPLLSEKTEDSQNELVIIECPKKLGDQQNSSLIKKKSKSTKTKSSTPKPLSKNTEDSQNELAIIECPKKLAVQLNGSLLIDEKLDLTETKPFTSMPLLSEKTEDSQNEVAIIECPKKLADQQNSSHKKKSKSTKTKSSTPKPLSKKAEDSQNEGPHRMECPKKLALQQNSLILIFNFLSDQSDQLSSSEILEAFKVLSSVTNVDVQLLEMILNEGSHKEDESLLKSCLKLVQDYLDTLVSYNPRRLLYNRKQLRQVCLKLHMKKPEFQRMRSCKIVLDKLTAEDIRSRGIKMSADSFAMLENLHARRNSASGEEAMSNIIDFVTRNS